ncbi:MAG: trypsin-like peptidase domain-containing protein [Xanthobacteraceae bacterium]|jgi:endonuclease G, mitochondrial
MPYLSAAELNELRDVLSALTQGDYLGVRPALISNLPAPFRAVLPHAAIPVVQLQLDLTRLNETERLSDGKVPFVLYLQGAVSIFGTIQGTEQLRRYLARIAQTSTGSPDVAPVTAAEVQEAVVHQDDLVPLAFMRSGLAAAGAVAKLQVPRFENGVEKKIAGEPIIFLGTGWLIANGLLITNHHVFNARMKGEPAASAQDFQAQALGTVVTFDFDDAATQGQRATLKALVASDAQLDYALARLDGVNRTPLSTTTDLPAPKPGHGAAAVNIIQHPDGKPKLFAIRNNLVAGSTDIDLRYFTDTSGGSSGAPVLDDDWQAVALHRGHTLATGVQFQGKSVAYINVGTRMSAVFTHLRANYAGKIAELGI